MQINKEAVGSRTVRLFFWPYIGITSEIVESELESDSVSDFAEYEESSSI